MRKLSIGLLCTLFAACGGVEDGDLPQEAELSAGEPDAKADHLTIPFTVFQDDIGSRGQYETRRLFTSAYSYRTYFGHDAPGVDFNTEWVVFYSAGSKSSGGYSASIKSISRSWSGYTLYATTSLSSPGPDCIVTWAFTKPYVLAKFKKPVPRPTYVRYYKSDTVRDCSQPISPCATVRCAAGYHCVEKQVVCVTTPCNPIAECVPDATGPFCGGIAGIPCPGAGTCVDNPNDSCDPRNGGADCGGICQCTAIGLCVQGYHWDSDPKVCGCVKDATTSPCAAVLCGPGTICKDVGGQGVCVSDGSQKCGTATCGAGKVCCNASCGICTDPGQFCIQIACL